MTKDDDDQTKAKTAGSKSDDGNGNFSFSYKLALPKLEECTTYDHYRNELVAWAEFSGVPVQRKAGLVAFSLPHNHAMKIREKVFQSISVERMKQDDGFEHLCDYMDSILKKDVLVDAWHKFDEFENLKRKPDQEIAAFIQDFDLAHHELVKLNLTIPPSILAFKLLKNASITDQNRLLVLTGMNFKDKVELYNQAKSSLKKFCSEEVKDAASKSAFKLEPEKVMMANNNNWRGRSGGSWTSSRRGMGRGSGSQSFGFKQGQGGQTSGKNPFGRDGRRLLCHICRSPDHMIANCPKNLNFLVNQETEEGLFTSTENSLPEEEVIVMTSVIVLADSLSKITEKEGHAILDTACSSTVCGQGWLKAYVNTLSEEAKENIEMMDSNKKFRFGGGEVFKSCGNYTIPACLAGKAVKIKVDVVKSEIPLLLSKDSMKAARIKINLVDDTAEILGVKTDLRATASGHYYVDIGPTEHSNSGEIFSVESVCAVNLSKLSQNSLKKALLKLHRQFAHPSTERLKLLIKDCGSWQDSMGDVLNQIQTECDICKLYAKTPARPSVAAPMAYDFNEKVALDLKKWKDRWILHIVDMWSRFTISVFITRKRPAEIIDKIMTHWIGAGYGIMGSVLTDNGGEFSAEEFREICSILNVEVLTTAAESPFQNGLCEKNHAIVDNMLLRLEEQCPKTPIEVLLSWANNAKNCLQMRNGFTSFQLVFGRSPRLPNVMDERLPAFEGTTTSEAFARHINGLHAARKAYIESETSERVRRALRTKVRTSEEKFQPGDRVFYKREHSERWLGPGRVVFQDGKVIFVRHGGVFVRVSPTRLVKSKESGSFNKPTEVKKKGDEYLRGSEFERYPDPTEEDDLDMGIWYFPRKNDVAANPSTREPAPINNRPVDEDRAADQNQIPARDLGSNPALTREDLLECERPTETDTNLGQNRTNLETEEESTERRVSSRNTIRHDYAKLNKVGRVDNALANFSPKSSEDKEAGRLAKSAEVQNWKKYGVYHEVADDGQFAISTRWVMTQKEDENGGSKVKARLVARGFEEPVKSQADSPTAGRDTLRLFLGLCSSLNWKCNTIDIRAAFLQGKPIDRDVFLRPPKDLGLQGKLWKLRRTVYGLVDASRSWYLSVRETLINLGCKQSKLDPALFLWYSGEKLSGMFAMHVDDFIWSGTVAFKDSVISSLSEKFEIGKEAHENFRYIGLDIVQDENRIVMSQQTYTEDLESIEISKSRQFHRHLPISEDERRALRGVVGRLNWVANQTRPDLSFETLDLSMSVNDATVTDLLKANKAVRQLKTEQCSVSFPNLGPIDKLRMVIHSDASHANLRDGVSSAGAYLIFLVGDDGESCPLSWKSVKIRRVVKSTLAAETMALVNAVDDALYLRHLLVEIIGNPNLHVPIDAYVDNRSLVENLRSTKGAQEKVLRIDLAILKDQLSKGDIRSVQWVESKSQLADSLTKRGPSTVNLRSVFSHGLKSVSG